MITRTHVWLGALLLCGLAVADVAPRSRLWAGEAGAAAASEVESPAAEVAAPAEAPPLPPVASGGEANWQVSEERSLLTGDVVVQLVTSARGQIKQAHVRFRPTLVLRCAESGLEASVVTGFQVKRLPGTDNEHVVTLRFGGDPARDVQVRSRYEKRVLLLEPAADLVREMLRNDQLELRFTPLSPAGRPIEMQFELTGLGDAMSKLDRRCSV